MLFHRRLAQCCSAGLLTLLLLAACQPARVQPSQTATAAVPSATASNTAVPTTTPTRLPSRTSIWPVKPTATRTSTLTATPAPTATATLPVFQPASTLSQIGTPLAGQREVIGASNLDRLVNVARWGKGTISDIAISPDGQTFVVATPFGLAVYAAGRLTETPRWIPFHKPLYYLTLEIGEDGLARLTFVYDQIREGKMLSLIYDLTAGKPAPGAAFVLSERGSTSENGFYGIKVTSPDGTRRFETDMYYMDGYGEQEFTSREVFDDQSNFLYGLHDAVPNLTYGDRSSPEGCDLEVFSPCGNALAPVAMAPYQAAFSDSGYSLTVLYRSPGLGNPDRFSTLRTYRASDGELLQIIGSYEQPVLDFVYLPVRDTIIIALADGTLQRWEIGSQRAAVSVRHFNNEIWDLAYSQDGKYLIVQRRDEIEVRRSSDGLLVAQYDAATFAVSPTQNHLALGFADGRINIEDLDRLSTVHHLEGHTALIHALAFSGDGLLLSSSSEDCTLRVWDAQKGAFLHYLEQLHVDPYDFGDFSSRIFVYSMEFLPGSDRLAGFGSWATMVSWSVDSGAKQFSVGSEPLEYYQGMMTVKPHFPESVFMDAEHQRFFIDSLAYSLEDGEPTGPYQPPEKLPSGCSEAGPVTRDGQVRFTSGFDGAQNRICILDAQDYHVLQTIQVLPDSSLYNGAGWPVLSPDGTQLVVPVWGGQIFVYAVGR